MSLAAKIHVNTRYTRSTNVERDRGSRSIIDAYLPTACGTSLLDDVANALGATDQPRAWSLIGPYGSGKSSFALFLHELLGGKDGVKVVATKGLAAGRPDLAQRFFRQQPWCRVVLTGSDEPLLTRLLAALDEAATSFWAGKARSETSCDRRNPPGAERSQGNEQPPAATFGRAPDCRRTCWRWRSAHCH